ncbi:MAG: hypothetical protein OSJ32_08755 [Muribaculaceae bacterium]|nr:hypothetical protein [Muribaculaceae bacterium]
MNPIKDEKLFFSPYYDEIAVNEVIQAPRDRGEFVMATDNHILIKVDKSLLKGEYQKAKKPNLAPIIENGNIRLTLAQLEEALSKCPQEEEEEEVAPAIPCRHCDGKGMVEWEFEDKDLHTHYQTDECPLCKGSGNEREAIVRKTGRSFPEYNIPILIDGVILNAYYIGAIVETMKQLGISEIRHTGIYKDAIANVFRIAEGITVILMPMMSHGDYVTSVKGKEVKQ